MNELPRWWFWMQVVLVVAVVAGIVVAIVQLASV
jgi:hypothetical protein